MKVGEPHRAALRITAHHHTLGGPRMQHVILIEDDALIRRLLERRLRDAGWRVTALRDGRMMQQVIASDPAQLIVLDLGLPHDDGLALLEQLRAQGLRTPVLVLTAYDLPHLHETVRGMGANDLVQKPFDQEELVDRMRRMMAA